MRTFFFILVIACISLSAFGADHAGEQGTSHSDPIPDAANKFSAQMATKPKGALRGNCLGACKGELCAVKLLPDVVRRAIEFKISEENPGQVIPGVVTGQPKEDSKYFKSHEGLFSDDLFFRPYAFSRLFEKLNISNADFNRYVQMIEALPEKSTFGQKLAIRNFVYPLVEKGLGLPPGIITNKMKLDYMNKARQSFYNAVANYLRTEKKRNLEFWNSDHKGIYNVIFGEFNYAWMAGIDIFENPEFNPNGTRFKRIFPVDKNDLGKAIYSFVPKETKKTAIKDREVPVEVGLNINLRDNSTVPSNAIIVYRNGSPFTKGTPLPNEKDWNDITLPVDELFRVDCAPGHIECKTSGDMFCSDGAMNKPATEWNMHRQVMAIYVPVNS